MESKIIQISSSVDEQGPFIVALCEDGSVWTSDKLESFEPFEEPFNAAQKKAEAPETMWILLTTDHTIQRYDQRFEPRNNNVKHWIMILVKGVGEKYNYHKHGVIRRKINTKELADKITRDLVDKLEWNMSQEEYDLAKNHIAKSLPSGSPDKMQPACHWHHDDEEMEGYYETECGRMYQVQGEIDLNYCPYCGKHLTVR